MNYGHANNIWDKRFFKIYNSLNAKKHLRSGKTGDCKIRFLVTEKNNFVGLKLKNIRFEDDKKFIKWFSQRTNKMILAECYIRIVVNHFTFWQLEVIRKYCQDVGWKIKDGKEIWILGKYFNPKAKLLE